jgi:hypothetical protein
MVTAIERAALADAARARVMVAIHQARELEHLAVYARECLDDRGELHDFAHLEVATLLHISDRAAQKRLRFALTLIDRLPATWVALRRGLIEEFKAQLIADAVAPLIPEQAGEVEQLVLTRAASQTPGQLRTALTKAVLTVDPDGAEARRQHRVRERRVESQPTDHGQAILSIYDSADRIAAMHGLITAMAHDLKNAGAETRTLSQIEADVARELILGSDCERRTVEVHLTLPATTAIGLDDQPGEIDGIGAIPAQAARELLAEASRWRWIRTNPETGHLDDLTYARYRPPKILKEFIQVRDRTCTFTGCTRPARRCDIDQCRHEALLVPDGGGRPSSPRCRSSGVKWGAA